MDNDDYENLNRNYDDYEVGMRRTSKPPYKPRPDSPYKKQYSLAKVQLTNGEMVGMTITAGPSLGGHLTKSMASDGYLNLFNDSEALIISADRVVAIKLTLMTTE